MNSLGQKGEAERALDDGHDGDGEDHQQHRDRRDGGIEELLHMGQHLDRQRLNARPGQENRDRDVVDRGDEGEDEGRDHAGADIGQQDREKRLERRRLPRLIAASSMEKSNEARTGADHPTT